MYSIYNTIRLQKGLPVDKHLQQRPQQSKHHHTNALQLRPGAKQKEKDRCLNYKSTCMWHKSVNTIKGLYNYTLQYTIKKDYWEE